MIKNYNDIIRNRDKIINEHKKFLNHNITDYILELKFKKEKRKEFTKIISNQQNKISKVNVVQKKRMK